MIISLAERVVLLCFCAWSSCEL